MAQVKKQSIQNLKESEMRYKRLFETAQDGILILDGNTGEINDVNPFLLKYTGLFSQRNFGETTLGNRPF